MVALGDLAELCIGEVRGALPVDKPDDFILAIVEFLDADAHRVDDVRCPFQRGPDFGVNYDFAEPLSERPR